MEGQAGIDRLFGGAGADRLTGGAGSDSFYFYSPAEGGDRITDFSSNASGDNDSLRLKGASFGGLGRGMLDPSLFEANSSGLATLAETRFVFEADTGILRFDADGSGAGGATRIVSIQLHAALTAADIVIF